MFTKMFDWKAGRNKICIMKQHVAPWISWNALRKATQSQQLHTTTSLKSVSLITPFIPKVKIQLTDWIQSCSKTQHYAFSPTATQHSTHYLCSQRSKLIHAFFKCSLQVFQFFYFSMMHLFKEWEAPWEI